MKYLSGIIIILLTILSLNSFGQNLSESELPQGVVKNFKAKYPDVYVYEWKWKKKKLVFEAEYIMKGSKYETQYTADGQWVKTERDIKKEELPQAVWKTFSETEYVRWKIDDIEEHSTPKYDLIYEIEVKLKEKSYYEGYKVKKKQKAYLYFLPNGKLVEVVKK